MLHADDAGEACSDAVGFRLWRNLDYGVFTVKVTKLCTVLQVIRVPLLAVAPLPGFSVFLC
jgi:hypothetical protein